MHVWDNETLLVNLVVVKLTTLFNHIGSSDDPSRYICIRLLNHSYNNFWVIILNRMLNSLEDFLQDLQEEFRTERGLKTQTHRCIE